MYRLYQGWHEMSSLYYYNLIVYLLNATSTGESEGYSEVSRLYPYDVHDVSGLPARKDLDRGWPLQQTPGWWERGRERRGDRERERIWEREREREREREIWKGEMEGRKRLRREGVREGTQGVLNELHREMKELSCLLENITYLFTNQS